MCRKVVQTFQQTFKNSDSTKSEQTFQFQRIYKTKPEQYFRLKLMGYSSPTVSTSAANALGDLFIRGIPELNGLCNYQEVGATSVVNTNNFYLGNFYDNFGDFQPIEMLLNDIPLTPFQIFTSLGRTQFIVTFIIELLED